MAKFAFRLQKVLEYRRMEEDAAKDQYVAAQFAKNERLAEIDKVAQKRKTVVPIPANTLDQRLQLERVLDMLDGEERSHKTVLAVLETEESKAEQEWTVRRQAVKVIEKLMEKAEEEWKLSEDRREQNELDEWTVTRRVG